MTRGWEGGGPSSRQERKDGPRVSYRVERIEDSFEAKYHFIYLPVLLVAVYLAISLLWKDMFDLWKKEEREREREIGWWIAASWSIMAYFFFSVSCESSIRIV